MMFILMIISDAFLGDNIIKKGERSRQYFTYDTVCY